MAAFLYRAVDPRGRTAKGVIEAQSAAAARRDLRARQLLPLTVEPTVQRGRAAAAADGEGTPPRAGGPRLGTRALALVTRQLSTLIGAGVPVEEALRIVAQGAGPKAAPMLLNLRAAVLDGRSLHAALGDYPRVFGRFFRASVRAGETAGRLGPVLEHLAGFVETRARNRQTVQLALLYPSLLAVVSLALVVGLLTFLVPDIVKVFTARGAELPLLTRVLIGLSDGLVRHGLALLAGLLAAGAAGAWLLSRPAVRLRADRLLATVPPFRAFSLRIAAAQFAGTLATLTLSGVPLAEALPAAADTVPNRHLRARAGTVAVRVREGAALSTAMAEAAIFPPMLLAMVASGEGAGTLGPALARAAADGARDLDAMVSAFVALVEPAVLLLMGGIVMLLVLSILLPIVNLNTLAV
ncbi:type II secretion system F family protein [Jannaschia sp. W003]|uniref:type II secretion system F family protein n=1 Tax=Jannaschia sp. W003 TaxID=2867012 RepID=UPI0021A81C66|nr:type II secretion system F family protein [Jannaschia sp. W003]UWQ23151.1 type II secretion system F family protein [Jannaschia sp. W003]